MEGKRGGLLARCEMASPGGGYFSRAGDAPSCVPEFALIADTSVALMAPLALTSRRKFALVAFCPDWALVCVTSEELTARLLVVSPTSKSRAMSALLSVAFPLFGAPGVLLCTGIPLNVIV